MEPATIDILNDEEKESILSIIENNKMETVGNSVEPIGVILTDENFSGVCLSGESKTIDSWDIDLYSNGYGWEDMHDDLFSCNSPLDSHNEKTIKKRPPSIIYRKGNEEFFDLIDQLVGMMSL